MELYFPCLTCPRAWFISRTRGQRNQTIFTPALHGNSVSPVLWLGLCGINVSSKSGFSQEVISVSRVDTQCCPGIWEEASVQVVNYSSSFYFPSKHRLFIGPKLKPERVSLLMPSEAQTSPHPEAEELTTQTGSAHVARSSPCGSPGTPSPPKVSARKPSRKATLLDVLGSSAAFPQVASSFFVAEKPTVLWGKSPWEAKLNHFFLTYELATANQISQALFGNSLPRISWCKAKLSPDNSAQRKLCCLMAETENGPQKAKGTTAFPVSGLRHSAFEEEDSKDGKSGLEGAWPRHTSAREEGGRKQDSDHPKAPLLGSVLWPTGHQGGSSPASKGASKHRIELLFHSNLCLQHQKQDLWKKSLIVWTSLKCKISALWKIMSNEWEENCHRLGENIRKDTHISDTGLLSKIGKELIQLKNRAANNLKTDKGL